MTTRSRLTCTGISLTLLALAITGCGAGKSASSAAPPAASTVISGKVVETMDAGGYTYVNLEKDGVRRWGAAPQAKVAVGQELRLLPGAEMKDFSSNALGRTFKEIVFSAGIEPPPPPAPTVLSGSSTPAHPILAGKVVETMNAMQYTYVKLEKDGKDSWSAVPITKVQVGDEVELEPGTQMGKFTSRALNKTFTSIYFASGLKNLSAPAPLPAAPAAAEQEKEPAAASLPSGHPKLEGPGPKAPRPLPAEQLMTGKVVETADAGGYTYICLERDGKRSWAAIPPAKVAVGDELALTPGVTMNNFVSKSLNRTFDSILFSNGVQPR